MLPLPKFLDVISFAEQNRRLLARVALNAIRGQVEAPVDISELRKLTPVNRALTEAFLTWSKGPRADEDIPRMSGEATMRLLKKNAL